MVPEGNQNYQKKATMKGHSKAQIFKEVVKSKGINKQTDKEIHRQNSERNNRSWQEKKKETICAKRGNTI